MPESHLKTSLNSKLELKNLKQDRVILNLFEGVFYKIEQL